MVHYAKAAIWRNTMDRKIDKTITHIRDLDRRLNEADNNLRYIKVVQALKYSLDKLYTLLLRDTALQREYQSTYIIYFYGGSLSFYNKVCNSLLDYKYGTDLSKSSLIRKVNVVLIINSLGIDGQNKCSLLFIYQ